MNTACKKKLSIIVITAFILTAALSLVNCGGGGGGGETTPNPTPATYTVTYDGNGSTGGSVPVDTTAYAQGHTVIVSGNTSSLVKTGYSFAGWNTQADGTGTTYAQAQAFTMGSANLTLYAKWTANPTFTVTYNGNGNTGGSVPTDSTNYEQGQTVTIPGNTGSLVKIGYAYAGWNTQADGTGTTYAQGQTLALGSANLTLYAKWTANPTYTVTYNGNGNTGGSVPTDSTNYEQGQTVTVLGNTGNLIKAGYSFGGWNTKADGSGTTFGATFVVGTANATLYAKWNANPTYTVTYNANGSTGGAVPSDATNYEQGQIVPVPENPGNLVKTNYTFVGWNTQADGSGTSYTQWQTLTMGSANITLYAKWTASPTYTVTYNANNSTGGSMPTDSSNYEQGQNVTVPGNAGNLVKTGYAFSGWNTQADGSGTTYTQSQTFLMGAVNVTLYAKWTYDFTEGLAAYYACNGNVTDSAGNADGTAVGGFGYVADRFGTATRACSFNGTDAKIAVSHQIYSPTSTGFSLALWAKRSTSDAFSGVLVHGEYRFVLWEAAGKLFFTAFSGSTNTTPGDYYPQNAWTHYVITYDNTTFSMKVYKNGIFVSDTNKGGNGGGLYLPTLNLGQNDYPSADYWSGALDDIRIYDRVLPESEILQLYQFQNY